MSLKLLAFTDNGNKVFRQEEIETLYGANFEYIDTIPFELPLGHILFVQIENITLEFISKIQYTKIKFVVIVESMNQKYLKRMLTIGGDLFTFKCLPLDDFLESLTNRIHLMEMFKLLHIFSHTDVELFRFILRAGNGEKTELSRLVFGSTSENTLEVNLSRLRKKLRDPDIGDDFFRIVSKRGRLYLVSRLTNYMIPRHLLEC